MFKMRLLTIVIAMVVVGLITPGVRGALIAMYEFEGDANNSVGREHGQLMGDAKIVTDPVMGSVLSLDGDGDYVSFSDVLIETKEFTLTAWANIAGQAGGRYHSNTIFSQRDNYGASSTDISTVNLYAHVSGSGVLSGTQIRSSDGTMQSIYAASASSGEWHHYAVTVDRSTITYYVDGTAVMVQDNLQSGDYDVAIDYVSIGRHRYTKPNTGEVEAGFFNGMIDDVRIYDFGMTSAELNSAVIPEPATLCLLGFGGLLLRRRR